METTKPPLLGVTVKKDGATKPRREIKRMTNEQMAATSQLVTDRHAHRANAFYGNDDEVSNLGAIDPLGFLPVPPKSASGICTPATSLGSDAKIFSIPRFLHVAFSETQGRRPSMEDQCFIACVPLENGDSVDLIAIFDGHNGMQVSNYLQCKLVPIFMEKMVELCPNAKGDLTEVLKQTFAQANARLKEDNVFGGSTGLVIAFHQGKLYIANTGDCRAVLSCDVDKAQRITTDHKPDNPREKERLEALGASITRQTMQSGKQICRLEGILGLSRSFGDFQLLPYISADPDIFHFAGADMDKEFLVVACDGLWDEISDLESVQIVRGHLAKSAGDWEGACNRLRNAAYASGSSDNITCMIIHNGTHETRVESTSKSSKKKSGHSAPLGDKRRSEKPKLKTTRSNSNMIVDSLQSNPQASPQGDVAKRRVTSPDLKTGRRVGRHKKEDRRQDRHSYIASEPTILPKDGLLGSTGALSNAGKSGHSSHVQSTTASSTTSAANSKAGTPTNTNTPTTSNDGGGGESSRSTSPRPPHRDSKRRGREKRVENNGKSEKTDGKVEGHASDNELSDGAAERPESRHSSRSRSSRHGSRHRDGLVRSAKSSDNEGSDEKPRGELRSNPRRTHSRTPSEGGDKDINSAKESKSDKDSKPECPDDVKASDDAKPLERKSRSGRRSGHRPKSGHSSSAIAPKEGEAANANGEATSNPKEASSEPSSPSTQRSGSKKKFRHSGHKQDKRSLVSSSSSGTPTTTVDEAPNSPQMSPRREYKRERSHDKPEDAHQLSPRRELRRGGSSDNEGHQLSPRKEARDRDRPRDRGGELSPRKLETEKLALPTGGLESPQRSPRKGRVDQSKGCDVEPEKV